MPTDPRDVEARLRDATRSPDRLRNPEAAWENIQAALREPVRGAPARRGPRGVRHSVPWPLAVAAGLAAIVLGSGAGLLRHFTAPATWRVVALNGAAPVAELAADTWLETSADERLRLMVGRIGQADVGPASRLRIDRGGWNEHRVTLERGRLDVIINAPPRLFFVQTPTVLATDLGCAYELEVLDDGRTRLLVTAGWVELAEGDRRSLVPAGMEAWVTADGVPGTPRVPSMDSSAREALRRVDAGVASDEDVAAVLAAMPPPDALAVPRREAGITLWHALQRVDARQRTVLVDALWRLAPPSDGVTREGILALDRQMLDDWRRSLNPMWGEEAAPAWIAWGRKLWLWAMD